MNGPSLRQLAIALLVLGLLGTVTYGRVVDNGYAFDAFYIVRDNPQVRPEATLREVFTSPYWTGESADGRGLYRPLSVLSFQQTRRLFAAPVAVDHGIDLGLHVLCGVALLAFLMQMGARFGVALTLATLFLLHPTQTEVVASLVGRTDLLATLFALLAMNLALASRVSGPLVWIGIWGLFSASLLSKESAASLPLLLPVCWAARELWRGATPSEAARGAVPIAISLGLAIVGIVILRSLVLGDVLVRESAMHGDAALGFFELRWRALGFASLYAQKLLWPHPLLPDYLTGVVPVAGFGLHLRALVAGVLIAASVAWPVWTWFRHRRISRVQLGLVLFWVAIAPVSNLIIQIGTPFGERLLYFPLVFLLIAPIDLPIWRDLRIQDLGRGPKAWPVWAAVMLAMILASSARIPEWKNNRRLFQAAVRDCPQNYYSQMAFGATLIRESSGEFERDLARKAFSAAAEIDPDAYAPRSMLGQLDFAEGDLRKARTEFERADRLAKGPEREPSLLNLSRTEQALGDVERAEVRLSRAAREHPEWLGVHRELGDHWFSRGQIALALVQFEHVLARQPEDLTLWRAVIWSHLYLKQEAQARERLASAPPGTLDSNFERLLARDGLSLPK